MAISDTDIYGPSSSDIPGTEMNLFYNLGHTQQSCFFALNTVNGKKTQTQKPELPSKVPPVFVAVRAYTVKRGF